MKKITLCLAFFLVSNSAFAIVSFLTRQWINQNGDQMCDYDNGSVLNVGSRICPLSIQG